VPVPSGRPLPAGARYLAAFRLAGVTAFLGYSLALWQMSIWYRRAWGTTIRAALDGLIYAPVTAGTFGWLWPHQRRKQTHRRGGRHRNPGAPRLYHLNACPKKLP